MNQLFKGAGVALCTPFSDGTINEDALAELIEWHIAAGTDALILAGTTGESATLSHEEKLDLFKMGLKLAAGRIQIIAGTGSNNTAETIALSKEAEAIGVDGLLLVVPAYNKPSQRGLLAHYRAIAQEVSLPIILYNVPGRTALDMKPETVIELSFVDNIVALKEASGDVPRVRQILADSKPGFMVYAGNDGEIFDVLELGGHGVISVLANICPAETKQLTVDYWSGDKGAAKAAQAHFVKLIDALFIETNPVPVKVAMNLMGLNAGPLRLPLVELAPENQAALISVMTEYELLED